MMEDITKNVFVSYSDEDEMYFKELKKYMQPLIRNNIIKISSAQDIPAGSIRNEQIKTNIYDASIVLFLLSPNFIASDHIYEFQIKIAFELQKAGKIKIVPIVIKQCTLDYTPFITMQSIPKNPIESGFWNNVSDAYNNVAAHLIEIIKDESTKKLLIAEEETIWKEAIEANTKLAYINYIKTSKLKYHIVEAVEKSGDINLFEFQKYNVIDPLEHQILLQNIWFIRNEIHDNIGQVLSASLILLSMAEMDKDTSKVVECRKLIMKAMSDLRDLSKYSLSGIEENAFPLKQLIDRLVISFQSITFFLKLEFEYNLNELNNSKLEIDIYRIINELMHNIVKHANADNAIIRLESQDNHINIQVSDNGRGFDVKNKNGKGLKSIENIVSKYNGKLLINTEKGTEVIIEIPVLN